MPTNNENKKIVINQVLQAIGQAEHLRALEALPDMGYETNGDSIFNKIQEKLSSEVEAKTESDVSYYKGVTRLWLRALYADTDEEWKKVQENFLNEGLNLDVLNQTPQDDEHRYKGVSVLWLAVKKKKWETVEKVLDKYEAADLDINAMPQHDEHRYKGVSVLWLAAKEKKWEIVEKVLDKYEAADLDINAMPKYDQNENKGVSVLWLAAKEEKWEIVEKILDKYEAADLDINAMPKHDQNENKGVSVLWLAAKKEKWEIVEKILKAYSGLEIDATPQNDRHADKGVSVLWLTVQKKKSEIVKKILKTYPGIDINATPYHPNYFYLNLSVLEMLVMFEEWELVFLNSLLKQPTMKNLELIKYFVNKCLRRGPFSFNEIKEKELDWKDLLNSAFETHSLSSPIDRVRVFCTLAGAVFKLTYPSQTSKLEHFKSISCTLLGREDLGWGHLINSLFEAYSPASLTDRVQAFHTLVGAIFESTYTYQTRKLNHLKSIIYTLLDIKEKEERPIQRSYKRAIEIFADRREFSVDDVLNKAIYLIAHEVVFSKPVPSEPLQESAQKQAGMGSLDDEDKKTEHCESFFKGTFLEPLQESGQKQAETGSLDDEDKETEQTKEGQSYFEKVDGFLVQALDLLETIKSPKSDEEDEYAVLRKQIVRKILSKQCPDYFNRYLERKQDPAFRSESFPSKESVRSFVDKMGSENDKEQAPAEKDTQNAKLTEQNAGLTEKNAELTEKNAGLAEQVAALTAQLEELRSQLVPASEGSSSMRMF